MDGWGGGEGGGGYDKASHCDVLCGRAYSYECMALLLALGILRAQCTDCMAV